MQNWAHWNPLHVEMGMFAEQIRFAMVICDAMLRHTEVMMSEKMQY